MVQKYKQESRTLKDETNKIMSQAIKIKSTDIIKARIRIKISDLDKNAKKIVFRIGNTLKNGNKVINNKLLSKTNLKLLNLAKSGLLKDYVKLVLLSENLKRLKTSKTTVKIKSLERAKLKRILDKANKLDTSTRLAQDVAQDLDRLVVKDILKDLKPKRPQVPKIRLKKRTKTKPPSPPKVPKVKFNIPLNKVKPNQIALYVGTYRARAKESIPYNRKTNPRVTKVVRKKDTKNRALKHILNKVDRSTARNLQIEIEGVTKKRKKDIKTPNVIKKFQRKKSKNPRILKYVELAKYSIDNPGEVIGLALAKRLKKAKPKKNAQPRKKPKVVKSKKKKKSSKIKPKKKSPKKIKKKKKLTKKKK